MPTAGATPPVVGPPTRPTRLRAAEALSTNPARFRKTFGPSARPRKRLFTPEIPERASCARDQARAAAGPRAASAAPEEVAELDEDGVPLASWGKRVLGWLIDGIILGIILAFLTPVFVPEYTALVEELTSGIESGDTAAINEFASSAAGVSIKVGLLSWLVASIYAIAFWATTAQTPGKMVLNISVRHTDRPGPLDLVTAIKRRLLPLVGTFIGLLNLIDGLWPLWDSRRQALHDKVASTYVVVGKQPRRPM